MDSFSTQEVVMNQMCVPKIIYTLDMKNFYREKMKVKFP